MKKLLSTFVLCFCSLLLFAQCYDPQACNYGSDESSCINEANNTIDITNDGFWLQEVDNGCDGIIDQVWYTEYYSNGSYGYSMEYGLVDQIEGSWSWYLCNDQFIDNYNYAGNVNGDGHIVGTITNLNGCDYACWRMKPVNSGDIEGCMDALACNYNSFATIPSNDCVYNDNCTSFNQVLVTDEDCIEGCMEQGALNWDPNATVQYNWEDCVFSEWIGPCQYWIDNGQIPGFLIETEADEFGNCSPLSGCTDYLACNYMWPATIDDGSCYYPEDGYDCMGNCHNGSTLVSQDAIIVDLYPSESCNLAIAELSLVNDDWVINSFGLGEDENYVYSENASNIITGPFPSNYLSIDLDISYQAADYPECNVSYSGNTAIASGGSLPLIYSTLRTPICYITVENNYNVIHWNEVAPNIVEYNIYRNNFGSEYELMGSTSDLSFIDEESNSAQQSYKYKLSGVDDCGVETMIELSGDYDAHETIHLSSNLGVGGENNLFWNAYIGFQYETYEIFRSNNGGEFELINQIPSSNYSYTDVNPPSGLNEYFISISQIEECADELLEIPNIQNLNMLNASRSNTIQATTEGATWNCLNNSCIDPGDGSGFYSDFSVCEAECSLVIEDSWNCLNNSCIDPGDGSGFFSSLAACETDCHTSSVTELNKANKKLKKITNLLGQETPIRKNTPMFYIYDDGTVEKKVIIE